MLDKIFKFLLIIYPPILLWNPEELFIINRIIGGAFIGIYIMKLIFRQKQTFYKIDYIVYLLLFVFLLSTIINNSLNIINLNISTKYLTPLIIGTYSLYYIDKTFLSKYFKGYFWFFLIIWFVRFAQFGFPFRSVTILREEMWWDKVAVFGYFYVVFYFGFLFIKQNLKQNIKLIKYIYALPLFLMGSRSIILGTLLIFTVYIFTDLKITAKKVKTYLFSTIIIGVLTYSALFQFIMNNRALSNFLGSYRDLNTGDEATLSTFSSGRTEIWTHYFDQFEFANTYFGYGGLNTEIGFSLHSDFLEMFFFYGIFAFILFVIIVFNIYIKKGLQSENPIRVALLFFILLQFFLNPFSSTMTASFFIILTLNYDYKKLTVLS